MRIAVISDIHANLFALNLAINNLKNENVDKIVFLGDYITDGENENDILTIVKNISDYAIIGNREKYMLDYAPAKKAFNNYKTIAHTFNNLNKESLEYIKSLKESHVIKINNYKVLMIHGDGYYNDQDDAYDIFDKIISDFDFDICLFGHSHRYLYKEYRNKIFLNPGSIGMPCDNPTYKYCILEITDKVSVFLKEFATGNTFSEFTDKYKKTNYYKNNSVWSNLILFGIKDGKDYCCPFIDLFNDKIKALTDISVNEFNKIWDNAYKEFCEKFNLS